MPKVSNEMMNANRQPLITPGLISGSVTRRKLVHGLAPRLRALQTSQPRVPIVANVDGQPKTDAHAAIEALIRQVSAPVQWQACVEQLVALGVRRFVEVGPGATLSGMVKRIAKDATIVKFGTPEDLDEVMAACSN